MKTMKKTALAVIASMFLFASCEKEEKTTPSGKSFQTVYKFGVMGNPWHSNMLTTWIQDFETGRIVERGYVYGFEPFYNEEDRMWLVIRQSTDKKEEYINFQALVNFEYEWRDVDSMRVRLWKNDSIVESLIVGSNDTATIRGYY